MSEFVEHAKNFLIHTLTAQAKRKGVRDRGVQGDQEVLAHSSQLLPHPPQCY